MIEMLDVSERRACSYAGLSRTSYREPPSMNAATQELSARIVELALTLPLSPVALSALVTRPC